MCISVIQGIFLKYTVYVLKTNVKSLKNVNYIKPKRNYYIMIILIDQYDNM